MSWVVSLEIAKHFAKWVTHELSGWLLGWRLAGIGHGLSTGLRWLSAHTGVPAILVAAILVVVSYRLAKRSMRFVAQVSVVLAVLAALTKLGVLRF